MTGESPIVSVRGLQRVYQQGAITVNALRGVDLDVRRGEFTALMGPSGSGKTTLLNLIGGLDDPSGGTVEVDGRSLGDLNRAGKSDLRLQRLGFVFQSYNLIPVLSALENTEFVLMLQGMGKKQRQEKAMAVLAAVGLKGMEHRLPNELSGGQQQRVAVARAIATEPALVLADEPTANLDSKTAHELIELMEKLNDDLHLTFVFATHDPKVKDAAHRVVWMEDGRIHHEEHK